MPRFLNPTSLPLSFCTTSLCTCPQLGKSSTAGQSIKVLQPLGPFFHSSIIVNTYLIVSQFTPTSK